MFLVDSDIEISSVQLLITTTNDDIIQLVNIRIKFRKKRINDARFYDNFRILIQSSVL